MTVDSGVEMLDTATGTCIAETLSPGRVLLMLGRTRSLYRKLGLKTSSLNFFFEEIMLAKDAHFLRLGMGVDDVSIEPDSSMLKTEDPLWVIFPLENPVIEPGCDPTLPLNILHYSRSVNLR